MTKITVVLPYPIALVLYDALERLDESPGRDVFDEAEWLSVWKLTGQLESEIVEHFDPQYCAIVERAKADVLEGRYPDGE